MTLASNLSLASFADLVKSADVRFTLMFHQETSRAGGELLAADLAPGSWGATITTPPMTHADAHALMALINSRGGALLTFLLTPPDLSYPSSDPTGSIFGSATPVVGTITDRNTVAFTGFPNNYSIPLGTFFQILYDTSRYYLGQFAEAKTANGSGAVSATTIAPSLPSLITGGEAVTVKKPAAKFRVSPGSAYIAKVDAALSTVTFAAEQTAAK